MRACTAGRKMPRATRLQDALRGGLINAPRSNAPPAPATGGVPEDPSSTMRHANMLLHPPQVVFLESPAVVDDPEHLAILQRWVGSAARVGSCAAAAAGAALTWQAVARTCGCQGGRMPFLLRAAADRASDLPGTLEQPTLVRPSLCFTQHLLAPSSLQRVGPAGHAGAPQHCRVQGRDPLAPPARARARVAAVRLPLCVYADICICGPQLDSVQAGPTCASLTPAPSRALPIRRGRPSCRPLGAWLARVCLLTAVRLPACYVS